MVPRSWPLVASMLGAIALVTALAWWDQRREAAAALGDLGREQSVVAASVAASLRARLATGDRRDDDAVVREVLDQARSVERPGEIAILLAAPHETSFRATDGRSRASPTLRDALDRGADVVRLDRSEAASVGLIARTAMAGVARVDSPSLGGWGVVAAATAARERDRETGAFWRLLSSIVVASGLVLAFGGVALRRQRKELELERELAVAEARRARDAELQRASRIATMGTFAMGIAHEVSTPLGVIAGRAEQLLARSKDDERAARCAQVILDQSDRIKGVVRRFLDMARGGQPSLGHADPADVVRAAASAVEHRFGRARVALELDLAASMPSIQCDRALLEHAIANLLLNACEACAPGGHVEAAARADGAIVAFVVTDDGSGIAPEDAARATEPFFTTKPTGDGAGLGLAIANEIAKSHRGRLTLSARGSSPGTCASIEIPIAGGVGGG